MFHNPIFSIKNFTKIPKTADIATYGNCRYHNKFMEITLFLPIKCLKRSTLTVIKAVMDFTKGTLFNTAHAQH